MSWWVGAKCVVIRGRSEEHTSELQSLAYLVCRLLLEKKIFIVWQKALVVTHGGSVTQSQATSAHSPYRVDGVSVVVCVVRVFSQYIFVFFLKKAAAPRVPPFSPTRPSPF